jgi:hypothetical protein
MLFPSWLRTLRAQLDHSSTGRIRSGGRPRSPRPNVELLEPRTLLSAYVVTTTADWNPNDPTIPAGYTIPGSLRDAITQINADTSHALYASPSNPSADEIAFAITALSDTGGGYSVTTGVATLKPQADLPTVTNSVIVNGYTQAGAQPNDLAVGDDAALKIELNGALDPKGVALSISAGNSTVRGLAVDSFSNGRGIWLINNGGDVVAGNFIGTDITGSQIPDPNNVLNGGGVALDSSNNRVGGIAPGDRNVVSTYGQSGLAVSGSNNVIEGNYIGTDATGERALNNGWGIALGGNSNTVGGTDASARNVISGNNDGIQLTSRNNLIEGNYIGTDATGTKALGNNREGISLWHGAVNNTIGGTAAGAGNVISANADVGVSLNPGQSGPSASDILTANNLIEGNRIGTDYTGTELVDANGNSLGNASGGIVGYGFNNTIGGVTREAGNIIAGNGRTGGDGGVNTITGNPVIGNTIFENTGPGVWIEFQSTAGSGAPVSGNTIFGNSVHGVFVGDQHLDAYGSAANPTGVAIRGNSIHDNAGLGIDLRGDGVTLNDSAGHTGPNNFQDFPILTSAVTNKGGVTIIAGSFSSPSQPNTAITVDFYANAAEDPSGYGEGQIYLGSTTFTTNATGAYTIHSFKPSVTVPVGYYVTATATDPAGNISEFGPDVQITTPQMASHGNALTAASSGGLWHRGDRRRDRCRRPRCVRGQQQRRPEQRRVGAHSGRGDRRGRRDGALRLGGAGSDRPNAGRCHDQHGFHQCRRWLHRRSAGLHHGWRADHYHHRLEFLRRQRSHTDRLRAIRFPDCGNARTGPRPRIGP